MIANLSIIFGVLTLISIVVCIIAAVIADECSYIYEQDKRKRSEKIATVSIIFAPFSFIAFLFFLITNSA